MLKVSVIMPVYNGEKYVEQAVQSVLKQTWQEWELLVVNDGSTDNTASLLAQFNDPRICVITQKNGGEARARNTGLEHARGEYLAFLDADDLYLENALSDLVAYLDANPNVDVVYSDGTVTDEQGQPLLKLSEHRPGCYTGNVLEKIVLYPGMLTVNCTMTRRLLIEKQHIRFDHNFVIGPDWDFWIQVARTAKFGYLDKQTCFYRIHHSNITQVTSRTRRRQDMSRQRQKVLNAPWFNQMTVETRSQFLYQFVVGLLSDQRMEQITVLQGPQMAALPVEQQARIWRRAGVTFLEQEKDWLSARIFFREAVQRFPKDYKARGLLYFSKVNPRVGMFLVKTWKSIYRTSHQIRQIGKKQSRPMPQQAKAERSGQTP